MNRCQRLVRSLSEEEKKNVPLKKFSTLERRLYSIYLHQERDLSISELADRFAMHTVHISRTNTELLFKVAHIYPPTQIESYLRLFLRAKLFQTLQTEILTAEKRIRMLTSNDERIVGYNTLFSTADELPNSTQSIQFLKKLYLLCTTSNTVFPEGHLQAYELIILNSEIFIKKMCLVRQSEMNTFLRETTEQLAAYESQIKRINNPLLNCNYYSTMRAFNLFVKNDMATFESLLEPGLAAANVVRNYPYPFPPFSRVGSETTFLAILFFLHRDDDLINYVETLPDEQKEQLFFEYENLSLPNRYLEALISNDKFDLAIAFSNWYSHYLHTIRHFDVDRKLVVLKMTATINIITGNYADALSDVTQLSQLNQGKYYNRGRDTDIRKLECVVYILLDRLRDAELTIKRNIKWFGRNATTTIGNEQLILLKFLENALEHHNSKSKSSLKKCLRIFNQYPDKDSNSFIMRLIGGKFKMSMGDT